MNSRLYFLVLFLSCIGFHCIAQTRFIQKELDHNGNVSYAKLRTDSAPQPLSKSAELLKNMYSMRTTDELKPSEVRKEMRDELGSTHQYYQQYYKNVKVENGEVSVHSDKFGNIETIFGYYESEGEVDTEPKLSEAQALKYALEHIGAEVYKWQIPEEEQWIKEYFNDTYYPVGELVIVKDRLKTDKIYRLAYRFDIYAHKPMSRNYVWVDAITGDIIDMASRIRFANATGTAVTRYSGTRTITTDSYNGSYRLRETRNGVNISTFNMNNTGNYTSTDFTDNDNNWTAAEHSANNNNAALDAHWGAEMTYEYFKQIHSRNSWNNNGGALFSYVNGNLPAINPKYSNDNAFWDANRMTYGQGDIFSPMTTLDICAHEISHGICQSTANLLYQGESGAIDESLSDIWGACVENWATTNKQTWLIGEDLGFPFRSMLNPRSLGQPDTYGDTNHNWFDVNGCTPSDQNDYCGVHTNSGVMNYWFFLLSQGGGGTNGIGNAYSVIGIGIDKAAKIVYRAENIYMSTNTNFANARNATISAATDLYGNFSQEVISVTNAWHAVGVGDRFPPPTIIGSEFICSSVTYTVTYGTVSSWSKTEGAVNGPFFTLTPNGNSATVTVSPGSPYQFATLTAVVNGLPISKTIWTHAIAGPETICYSFNYSLTTGEIPVWSLTDMSWPTGFTLTTANNGATAVVTATAAAGQTATLQAVANGRTHALNIKACQGIVSGPDNLCGTATYTLEMGTALSWTKGGDGISIVSSTPTSATVTVDPAYNGMTMAVIAITSGGGIAKGILVSCGSKSSGSNDSFSIAYPNPTSDILYIDINDTAAAKSALDPTYEIRLYNMQGNQLRQTTAKKNGKVKFNVANLPNGTYFLHIHGGINAQQTKQQIIIRH